MNEILLVKWSYKLHLGYFSFDDATHWVWIKKTLLFWNKNFISWNKIFVSWNKTFVFWNKILFLETGFLIHKNQIFVSWNNVLVSWNKTLFQFEFLNSSCCNKLKWFLQCFFNFHYQVFLDFLDRLHRHDFEPTKIV